MRKHLIPLLIILAAVFIVFIGSTVAQSYKDIYQVGQVWTDTLRGLATSRTIYIQPQCTLRATWFVGTNISGSVYPDTTTAYGVGDGTDAFRLYGKMTPMTSNAFDIGTNTANFRTLYIDSVRATGRIVADSFYAPHGYFLTTLKNAARTTSRSDSCETLIVATTSHLVGALTADGGITVSAGKITGADSLRIDRTSILTGNVSAGAKVTIADSLRVDRTSKFTGVATFTAIPVFPSNAVIDSAVYLRTKAATSALADSAVKVRPGTVTSWLATSDSVNSNHFRGTDFIATDTVAGATGDFTLASINGLSAFGAQIDSFAPTKAVDTLVLPSASTAGATSYWMGRWIGIADTAATKGLRVEYLGVDSLKVSCVVADTLAAGSGAYRLYSVIRVK